MTIRDAKAGDAKAIAELLTELGYPNDEHFVLKKLRVFSERDFSRVLIAEVEHGVAGFICFDAQPLFHQEGKIGTIMALSIGEAFRRQGIGRALVERVETISKDVGCIKIAVASGLHRADAHRFYLELGYEEITKRFVKRLSE